MSRLLQAPAKAECDSAGSIRAGLLFGGTIDAGEAYGEAALETYADVLTDPDAAWYKKAGAGVGGFFSALWTPCTSDSTFATLSTAAGGAWRLARRGVQNG